MQYQNFGKKKSICSASCIVIVANWNYEHYHTTCLVFQMTIICKWQHRQNGLEHPNIMDFCSLQYWYYKAGLGNNNFMKQALCTAQNLILPCTWEIREKSNKVNMDKPENTWLPFIINCVLLWGAKPSQAHRQTMFKKLFPPRDSVDEKLVLLISFELPHWYTYAQSQDQNLSFGTYTYHFFASPAADKWGKEKQGKGVLSHNCNMQYHVESKTSCGRHLPLKVGRNHEAVQSNVRIHLTNAGSVFWLEWDLPTILFIPVVCPNHSPAHAIVASVITYTSLKQQFYAWKKLMVLTTNKIIKCLWI